MINTKYIETHNSDIELSDNEEDKKGPIDLKTNINFTINVCDNSLTSFINLIEAFEILVILNTELREIDLCATDETKGNMYHINLPISNISSILKEPIKFTINLTGYMMGNINVSKKTNNIISEYNDIKKKHNIMCSTTYITDWNGNGKNLFYAKHKIIPKNLLSFITSINVDDSIAEYLCFNTDNNNNINIQVLDDDDEEMQKLVLISKNNGKKINYAIKTFVFLNTFREISHKIYDKIDSLTIYLMKECPLVIELKYKTHKINISI